MKKYLEIGTADWSLTVEVDVCGHCGERSWAFWTSKLWQNPATGKVHRQINDRTECGVELPKRTASHRVLASVKVG